MKTLFRSVSALLCLLSLLGLLNACGVIAVGAVAGSASVLADRRTAAAQATDIGIQLEAGAQLSNKFGKDAHINVTSFNQQVLLTGEVKTAEMKSQAEADVKQLKNVRTVFNELTIGPISSYTARANDAYLTSKIKTEMIFTNNLPSNSMVIVTEGTNVYMLGILTAAEAASAKKIASSTNGVKAVYTFFDLISEADKERIDQANKNSAAAATKPAPQN
ncbi:BON domain-containing protein [Polynucleobacter sp. IMCC30063]|uniref:BON domain-containing protein n=1 Tax=Polynucleobacter sp. IMCC30063 TaxID=2907298 RepID=UPI001F2B3131|nr:BON domain-containing protein [Polynucleobacter sp. IMCC30063]MCE7504914.1 BON domain-containing protein [Polynucleobacter sp. IMCC30063]